MRLTVYLGWPGGKLQERGRLKQIKYDIFKHVIFIENKQAKVFSRVYIPHDDYCNSTVNKFNFYRAYIILNEARYVRKNSIRKTLNLFILRKIFA